jgi:hypothetical protein
MARSTIPPFSPPPSHHEHEHEHHHRHSHYDRSVHEDGTVVEKTVIEDVQEVTDTAPDPADQPKGGGNKKKGKKTIAKATAVAAAEAEVIERTVTETVKEIITVPPSSRKAPSVITPTFIASTSKTPSVRAPSIVVAPAEPAVVAPIIIQPPVPVNAPAPPSPARSHHHPEIIVNVNVPAALAPAPAPAPPVIVAPKPISVRAHSIRVPSLPASPAGSVSSMRLPKCLKPADHVGLVQAVPEVDEDSQDHGHVLGSGEEAVTKVITTTTTTRRAATPPREPSPVHEKYDPFIPIVESDPAFIAPPHIPKIITPPPPAIVPNVIHPVPHTHTLDGMPHKTIETTTVETVSYPLGVPTPRNHGGKSVVTTATTIGDPTTEGYGRSKTALELVTEGRQGMKGGLKPIPIGKPLVDPSSQADSTSSRLFHSYPTTSTT